ncbi:MAG: helix-turn-helix domain-containing protein [Flammeovirgaceae bacterium]|nr:helix-turn-helix domain-containing protein [Flammeovirgaceae bacterium]
MIYSFKHPPLKLCWLLFASSLFVFLLAIIFRGLDYFLLNLSAFFNGENYQLAAFLATVLPSYFLGASLLLFFFEVKNNLKQERILDQTSSAPLPAKKDKITLAAERLKQLLEKDQIFKNPELDLEKLAQLLKVKPYLIRSIIKKTGYSTLAEMMSQYRIQQACLLIKQHGQKKNLKDIYYEVGYSTRKAFNTDFKKMMGCTASEFLDGIIR